MRDRDAPFRDRADAGRRLAADLVARGASADVVLALPRGGVPVAREVAGALAVPWDVLVVRKLGLPGHEELAMGAIGAGDVRVWNEDVLRGSGVRPEAIERVEARERQELERRERSYRGDRAPLALAGRAVLIVDDGIATGATARAAVAVARAAGAAFVAVAAPVASPDTVAELRALADRVWVLQAPVGFYAVGQAYERFGQVSDEEVRAALAGAEGAV
ncbi:MAG: phosphoribosyltransferase family protein [Trueperaceae bacterium]|nr:phosphoribosyltransferase family protein [Trueperaceae bacterium]